MNRFIDIEIIGAQHRHAPCSQVKVELKPDIKFFYPEELFPFMVQLVDTYGCTVHYEFKDLNPGQWCTYFWSQYKDLIITNAKGDKVTQISWENMLYGSQSEIAFELWTTYNPNTKGVAIGTNEGADGEWVNTYHQGKFSEIMLVEASDDVFSILTKNFKDKNNVKLVNSLVTPHGGVCKFYEALEGQGYTNSVNKEHLLNFYKDIREVEKESIGINELLVKNGFSDLDWLHIDVEGLDDQLIMALDFNVIKKPKVIVYEKINSINSNKLEDFLHSNGYTIWVDDDKGFNNIAFLQ